MQKIKTWYKTNYVKRGNKTCRKNTSTSWALSIGALKDAKVNNIYDMAGNMYEWTMEGRSINHSVTHGGYFNDSGSSYAIFTATTTVLALQVTTYLFTLRFA